ncbi:MAG: hypothetical protein ACLR4A_14335 [Christensenellales bacterium]
MSTEKMRASFRLLMLIATPKLTDKALLLFEKGSCRCSFRRMRTARPRAR